MRGYAFAPTVVDIDPNLTDGKDGPFDSEGNLHPCPEEVLSLSANSPALKEMLHLFQTEYMGAEYQRGGLAAYGRKPVADKKLGPATYAAMSTPRCGCPDYGFMTAPWYESDRAVGSGPWDGCHEVGRFHASHWRFTNSPPSHLEQRFNGDRTIFQEALLRTQEAYREIGLLPYFSGPGTGDLFLPPSEDVIQSNASFVGSSDGWIGLAIVGNNSMGCSTNPIWMRFLAPFDQQAGAETKAHSWHLLIAHEMGHNCGLGHTNGGIMNPSLNRGSNGKWVGDVAESWMKGRFGGVPVPKDDPGPGPGPDPDPPGGGGSFLERLLCAINCFVGESGSGCKGGK